MISSVEPCMFTVALKEKLEKTTILSDRQTRHAAFVSGLLSHNTVNTTVNRTVRGCDPDNQLTDLRSKVPPPSSSWKHNCVVQSGRSQRWKRTERFTNVGLFQI